MNKVLQYFKDNQEKLIIKNIKVYGWKFEYDHLLISSISNYLFEDLNITENIAPIENDNRDGRKKEKKYICVHDTGDTDYDHTASFWSNVVKVQDWEMGHYSASFQYVTGNDGIYHNILDDEIAYHAGDGTMYDYTLLDSGVEGENENPSISITLDGYYAIDGKKTTIMAPRYHIEKNKEVIEDRVCLTSEINSQGILCKIIDGKYYLGVTYFNPTYKLIANRGGNNNSIGIESCINVSSDIYLTWQRTAKLVAKLLKDNNLSFDDVKQHHFFSGKDCPMTIRRSGMWEHFMRLVKMEYEVSNFISEGYKISFKTLDNRVSKNGRINLEDLSNKDDISFTIITEFEGKVEQENFIVHL